jgi:hypothetical protein
MNFDRQVSQKSVTGRGKEQEVFPEIQRKVQGSPFTVQGSPAFVELPLSPRLLLAEGSRLQNSRKDKVTV